MSSSKKFRFAIDRGGTFTDIFAQTPSGKIRTEKLLSVDPKNYSDAPTEGIRRILESETGRKFDGAIDTSDIEWIRMGTTVATNALLERKGERMALLVNEGFKDVLRIGNQARPKLFELNIVRPDVLYEEVVEVEGRVVLDRADCQLNKSSFRKVVGTTQESLFVLTELNEEKLRKDLERIKSKGILSLAIALMHSYTFHEHELKVAGIASEMGFINISLSSQIMPMVRLVPRGFTASVDAYLTPCIKKYLDGFASGFVNQLAGVKVAFMQSDGGLTPMHSFNGSRAILSGPAGGVVGFSVTTTLEQGSNRKAVIGFDMGGTSTDVSRFAGSLDHVFETTTAGVTIQAPQLDINTVAAGGGSMLFFRAGLFAVGPDSAGAHPGPVCYRKGGPLTITDANLLLGRLLPNHFPKIFGPNENEPLDGEGTKRAFDDLALEVNSFLRESGVPEMSVEEIAMGFIRVANEAMCRPIRNLTQGKGFDTRDHVLACFGGAGGQHACALARSLGMDTVFVHKYAGILSAYGMALADVIHEEQAPCVLKYSEENLPSLEKHLDELRNKCVRHLEGEGFVANQIRTENYLHLRYAGTDCALMCTTSDMHPTYLDAFLHRYQTEFGFVLKNRDILVDDVRVRGIGKTNFESELETDHGAAETAEPPAPFESVQVYFDDGYKTTNVYKMDGLQPGQSASGPCIIMDKLSTILVEQNCKFQITRLGNIRIDVGHDLGRKIGTELDTIQLSIFSHRFMSIAEQMGRILQRTSISTNIKERLDFSCALFDHTGGLVSNAPHIPVHLGAMQHTVRYQMNALKGNLNRGDVILANHPKAGGSHLPDLTVITPVFYPNYEEPVFYVANRGHHADIGGISPGSMPPHSKFLWEEGATFKTFKIVDRGVFQEAALVAEFQAPAKYPGCSGSRGLQDNLSDLKAQIAANQKGIQLVGELIDSYGLDVVQAYMVHIQNNAEVAVREMLKSIGEKALAKSGNVDTVATLTATDYMDDGSKITLTITIDVNVGKAVFDFRGSSPEVYGNINAPKAVVLSALIYSLRCLVGQDIPLNQGCLNPVEVIIPEGSILDPSEEAAVVGGNVLTSQRIVDVILMAFSACAASQGCCNNITFGDENFGYYETVAGGSGAGPTWSGCSGVHVHMTNTRLTDAEILERRYPVILDRFELAEGTGGAGQFYGGEGVHRHVRFRKPVTLSVLTDRRVLQPYGMAGGEGGARGLNLLRHADGRLVNLGGKCSVDVATGDVFILQTPGGGGWGSQSS